LKNDKIGFKDPSTCGSCVSGQILFRGIFGEDYTDLPFVKFDGDRHRTVDFKLAKLYAEKGEKGVKAHFNVIEQKKKVQEQEKKEQEKKRRAALSDKQKFSELAEEQRSSLRKRGQYGSSSDLYVAKNACVAVIGIQTSESGSGWDTIYVVKGKGDDVDVKTALDETFDGGRMFPTGISNDGKKFFYTVKDEDGEFHKHEKEIK
jgi:glucose/arabinose dehydrogenase